MNSPAIEIPQNGPNDCMVETASYAMTKAERMFLTKGTWHIEWKNLPYAKENVTHDLVNVYDWVMLPASVGEEFYQNGAIDLSKFPCHQLNGSFNALSAMRKLDCAMVLPGLLGMQPLKELSFCFADGAKWRPSANGSPTPMGK